MTITYTISSNKLSSKPQNGDFCKIFELKEESIILFLLADGVGGCVGDYKASNTAVEKFNLHFRKSKKKNISERISNSIENVNEYILSETGYYSGMKTTLVACVFDKQNSKLYYVSIGDSRLFSISKKGTIVLTKDHVKAVIRRKQDGTLITQGGVIVNAIGVTNVIGVKDLYFEVKTLDIEKTTSFLLASDGFYSKLTEGYEVLKELNRSLYFENKFNDLSKDIAEKQDDDASAIFFRLESTNGKQNLEKQRGVFNNLKEAILSQNKRLAIVALDQIESNNLMQTFNYYDNAIIQMRTSNFNDSEIYQRLISLLKKSKL